MVSANVETSTPELEIRPALDLLGPTLETFTEISTQYVPISNGVDDRLFITKSYDPQSHFEVASEEVLELYERITGENPYEVPMRIYPAVHYTMGGLWVDYNLMSNIPGLFVLGEANFSDHGANRLGASALMQGLADGYFVIPYTIGGYFAKGGLSSVSSDTPEARQAAEQAAAKVQALLQINGKRTSQSFHRALGKIMWDKCGMARNAKGLQEALQEIPALREEFWSNLTLPGSGEQLNQSLDHASRVADFMEFAELMVRDALQREESCGGHFREEYQTEDGEAMRNDADFAYVAAWGYGGEGAAPTLHREPLEFENVELATRSYK